MDIISFLPGFWSGAVTVLRGGGRDSKSNPLPVEEIPVSKCLVGPRSTAEPNDFSEIVDSTAVLYRTVDDGFRFLPSDRVVVPDGARMAGEWSVDGRPSEWPMGVEVGLKSV